MAGILLKAMAGLASHRRCAGVASRHGCGDNGAARKDEKHGKVKNMNREFILMQSDEIQKFTIISLKMLD